MMKLKEIKDPGPKREHGELESLKQSIQEIGLICPLAINDQNKLLAGRRRYQALKELDYKNVPVYRIKTRDELHDYLVSLHENIRRKNLTDPELAMAMKQYHELRQTQKGRAEKGGDRRSKNFKCHSVTIETQSQIDTARELGISRPALVKSFQIAEAVEQKPELAKLSGQKILNEIKRQKRLDELKAIVIKPDEKWTAEFGEIETYQTKKQFDFIITDPPYGKDYLQLYGILAKRAKEWLKLDGLLLAMCGQSYLDEIYKLMSAELKYYWTACYLTPRGPTPLKVKQVNTSWKPVLIYSISEKYKGKTFGDVFKSEAEDKTFDKWGQSESGMLSIIKQVCLPGQSIFDPFCGAGTTGIAALRHGCLFHGIDNDKEKIEISKKRLSEAGDK